MKIVAVGNGQMLIGFMLAGIKTWLDTDDPDEALGLFHKMEETETACLIIVAPEIYRERKEEIEEIQERKPSLVFYEFSGGLEWRKKT